MKRRVIWDQQARDDYLDIIRYIASDNPKAALRVATRINKAADSLGTLATGRAGRVTGTYEKILGDMPYILAYEILALPDGQERIVILHIIHTARDWPPGAWPGNV
jgi:plasmid stabilization system protein ParE